MSFATEPDKPELLSLIPAARLRGVWRRYGALGQGSAVALMTALALLWLGYQAWRLLFQTTLMGAVDLHLRYDEVHAWFAARPVYSLSNTAVYPPATFPLLWPWVGWLDWSWARGLWALTMLGALVWLGLIFVRAAGAQTRIARAFVLLMLLATYPVGASIGNGQLIVLQLPLLITAVLLVHRDGGWKADIGAALLLLIALMKPTTAAPFFWAAFFPQLRWRAPLLAIAVYAVLTLFAASFQAGTALDLIGQSLTNSAALLKISDPAFYGDVHVWLNAIGLTAWAVPVSVLLLLAHGGWTFLNRRADIWALIGVAGIIARLWTYHQWYDDALILPALLALYRIARATWPANSSVAAGVLLGLNVLFMLAPGGLFVLPYPLNVLYTSLETMLWLALLAFLMFVAPRLPTTADSSLRGGAVAPRAVHAL